MTAQIDPRLEVSDASRMRSNPRRKTRSKHSRQHSKDPALQAIVGVRAWLKHAMAGATFRILFASGLFVASSFVWPFLEPIVRPVASFFAITLGALMGTPIDLRLRRGLRANPSLLGTGSEV